VATRWYRAPEIMMSNRRYTTASKSVSWFRGYLLRVTVDVWSIGCILGELLGGGPMFKGKEYVHNRSMLMIQLCRAIEPHPRDGWDTR